MPIGKGGLLVNFAAIFAVIIFVLMFSQATSVGTEGAAFTAFEPKRGIAIGFVDVIRSATGSIIRPYYAPWNASPNRNILAETKSYGFDHVRLAVNPVGLLLANDDDRQQVFENIDAALKEIMGFGLNVVFDMHVDTSDGPEWNHDGLTASLTDQMFQRYTEVIGSVSHFLSGYDPHHVAIELFNEPGGPCLWRGKPQWSEFQKQLFMAARRSAPNHTIILTGPCWGTVDGLPLINPLDYDANTLFTIHFYEPLTFVDQGAPWSGSGLKYVKRLPYPPVTNLAEEFISATKTQIESAKDIDDAEKVRAVASARKLLFDYFQTPMNRDWIKARLSLALDWADRNKIARQRLWIGEFGTMRDAYGIKTAGLEDRLRWFRDVTDLFAEAGISWSVWHRAGLMGVIIGDRSGPLDPRIMDALGLRRNGQ